MSAASGAPPAPALPPRRRGGGLASGAVYSLVGQAAPLAVAYFAIPVLARELGTARFGLLTLAWAVLGYFSLFDFGLGRALTQTVAERLADGREEEVPPLVWTGLALMLLLGLMGAAVAALLAPWLVARARGLPAALEAEALAAVLVLAASIPVVIVSAAVRGVLEAAQRFDLVNAVRLPLGAVSFAGPVLVLPLSRSLATITAVLLAGRLVAGVAWYCLMLRELPGLGRAPRLARAAARPLLRFGSWMTVSNVISPLMVTLDRFVIGGMAGVGAVAYYTAPWEAVTKLWLVPTALGAVLFPAFATARAGDGERTRALYVRGTKTTFLTLLPVIVVVVGFAPEGLGAWLGPDYARESAGVLRWLAVGVLVNSAAALPYALVQGHGRPDLTAKLHLAELPTYLVVLWWLVAARGIEGAAIAWTLRVSVDAAALFFCANRLVPVSWPAWRGTAAALAAGSAAAAALAVAPLGIAAKCALAALLLAGCLVIAWRAAFAASERRAMWALAATAQRRARLGGAPREGG